MRYGYNAFRMIIQSLLDTDLYKFTMMQVVLHHFPTAQVEYRFKCRTPGVDLTPYVGEIEREIGGLCGLRFSPRELDYLRRWRFLKSDFVDLLGLFHLDELREILAAGAPRNERRAALLREVEAMLVAGVPAVNVCSLEGLSDELFTYAGCSGQRPLLYAQKPASRAFWGAGWVVSPILVAIAEYSGGPGRGVNRP